MRKLIMTTLISAVVITAGLPASAGAGATKNGTARASAPLRAKASVKISSFKFEPKVLTVAPGTTVEWVNDGGRHSVEADDGSFKSEALKQGDKFEHTFDKPGKYPYHCEFHGEKGGKDMAGTILVRK